MDAFTEPSLLITFVVILIVGILFIYGGSRFARSKRTQESEWDRAEGKITNFRRERSISPSSPGGSKTDVTINIAFDYKGRNYKIMSQYMNMPVKYIPEDLSATVLIHPDDPDKSQHYVPKLHHRSPKALMAVGIMFLFFGIILPSVLLVTVA